MDEPVLYILMRNDLASMNPGKAMAQASHAAHQLNYFYNTNKVLKAWHKQTYAGFGTVLVLAVNEEELTQAVAVAHDAGYPCGVVEDPTYPYQVSPEVAALIPEKFDTSERVAARRKVTLFRKEQTCGFILGTKEELKNIVGAFPLYK